MRVVGWTALDSAAISVRNAPDNRHFMRREAREHERLDVAAKIVEVLPRVRFGDTELSRGRFRDLVDRGEERGELVRDPSPLVVGELAEGIDVQLAAGEQRVAGERAVGGPVGVVGDADVDPRLEVAKQPHLVGERIPVRLRLRGPEDDGLVEDDDRVVPAMGQVSMRCPPQVGELRLDSPQERPFFHGVPCPSSRPRPAIRG